MQRSLLILILFSTVLQAEIRVQDYSGQEVVLQQPAQRVIGLAPHVVENLYTAGAGQRMVGAVSYSDYPPAAARLPVVGDYSRINYELISQLKPDLIVAWNAGRAMDGIRKLRELGFAVYVDDPHKLADVARSIRDMGALLGTEQHSEAQAKSFLQEVEQLRGANADMLPVSVFYQVWQEPLQTLSGEHIVSDVIKLCGGRNIFAEEESLAPKVSIEAVIARNPQAIIFAGEQQDISQHLKAWQRWPVIKAVQGKHVYSIPSDLISRHTVRILDAAKLMCDQLNKVRAELAINQ